jgi:beta-mannosidase
MLHYFAKKFFSPVLVSSYEDPLDQLNVHVTSDKTTDLEGQVQFFVWRYDSKAPLGKWNISYSLKALESKVVEILSIQKDIISPHCKGSRTECFLVLECKDKSGTLLSSNEFFLSEIYQSQNLQKPNITITGITATNSKEASITLTSDYPALYTFLSTHLSGYFSENGFLLLPSSPKTILFDSNQAFDVNELKKSLSIISIRDTY